MPQSPLDRAHLYQDELSSIRRDIHAHPELGLEEHRTADLVARKWAEWGIEVSRCGRNMVAGGTWVAWAALPTSGVTPPPHKYPNRCIIVP